MKRSQVLVLVLFELNELLEVKDPRVVFEGTLRRSGRRRAFP